ncbi:hypothetical protein ONS96_009629 [Cadophora gregata f. sp. sojae]|nr:hypothetical protein ONS96_009629 [Cadophora gregata f. sp. sojae]
MAQREIRANIIETGYGPLLKFYITYLKALLASLSTASSIQSTPARIQAQIHNHLTLSLASHTLREVLLKSITSCPASTRGAKLAVLRLVILDALALPTVHQKLVATMRDEGVGESVVMERECVFERRREEVVGFVERCEELELGLDLEDWGDGKRGGDEVVKLERAVEVMRIWAEMRTRVGLGSCLKGATY